MKTRGILSVSMWNDYICVSAPNQPFREEAELSFDRLDH